MIHLKTYENFISKGLSNIWNKLTNVASEHGKLLYADWYDKELDNLEDLGFTTPYGAIKKYNNLEYTSDVSDLKIVIYKYYDEQIPGYAPVLYKISVHDVDKYYSKEFSDLDKMLTFIKSVIPEEEIDAKKYNL